MRPVLELLVQIEARGVAVSKCGIERETGSEIGSTNIEGYFKENKLTKEPIKEELNESGVANSA